MNEREFDKMFTEMGIEIFDYFREYEQRMKAKHPEFRVADGFIFTVVMTIKDNLKKRLVNEER